MSVQRRERHGFRPCAAPSDPQRHCPFFPPLSFPMKLPRTLSFACLAIVWLLAVPLHLCAQTSTDLDALLGGVTRITRPGAPGGLVVYGEQAFAVVTGPVSASVEPVVAA